MLQRKGKYISKANDKVKASEKPIIEVPCSAFPLTESILVSGTKLSLTSITAILSHSLLRVEVVLEKLSS